MRDIGLAGTYNCSGRGNQESKIVRRRSTSYQGRLFLIFSRGRRILSTANARESSVLTEGGAQERSSREKTYINSRERGGPDAKRRIKSVQVRGRNWVATCGESRGEGFRFCGRGKGKEEEKSEFSCRKLFSPERRRLKIQRKSKFNGGNRNSPLSRRRRKIKSRIVLDTIGQIEGGKDRE